MRISTGSLAAAAIACIAATAAQADDRMAAAGKIFFEQRCQICHNPEADRATYGPPLAGVVDRKAGSVEGFEYSDAMKNSGIVWTEGALKAWMADNDKMLPGTRMRHVGVSDDVEQDMILAYLKSLAVN